MDSPSARSGTSLSPEQPLGEPAKRLQLRKARFRGAVLPQSSPTPAPADSTATARDLDAPDALDDLPLHQLSLPDLAPLKGRNGSGVLQEISNSSMRRKRRSAHSINTSPGPNHNTQKPTLPADKIFANSRTSSASLPSSPLPDLANNKRPRSSRASMIPRRVTSGSTSKYIEHLESQLAALQTQLHSLTSPGNTRAHSAKLRAMTTETRLLQDELADWESKFSDRLKEQMDHQDVVTRNLQAHIVSLQHEAESSAQRMQELELELEEKQQSLEATENANYQLEQRLEFLSELVATSPGKFDLHMPPPPDTRRKANRPISLDPTRANLRKSVFSPERAHLISRQQAFDTLSQNSPSLPPTSAGAPSEDSFDSIADAAKDNISGNELPSEISETTLVDYVESSPSRRASLIQPNTSDTEGKSKPARRMRRFYPGSATQSLILPTTTTTSSSHPVSHPISAPIIGTPTPLFPGAPFISTTLQAHPATGLSQDRPSQGLLGRRRSSTWDEEGSTANQRKRGHFRSSLSLPLASRVPHVERPLTPESAEPARPHKPYSIGRNHSRNLFEELSRIKQQRQTVHDHDDKLLTPVKHIDCALSDTSTLASPARFDDLNTSSVQDVSKIPPSHNATEVDDTLPIARSSRDTFTHTLTFPLRRFFFAHTAAARHLFNYTWQSITMSRPVLEFRLWLIRLLLGRLHEKGTLLLKRRPPDGPLCTTSTSLGLGLASSLPLVTSPLDEATPTRSTVGRRPRDQDTAGLDLGSPGPVLETTAERCPPPPGVTWLKFSLTLVCAVGIAFRDGPGSLFAPCQDGDGGQDRLDSTTPTGA